MTGKARFAKWRLAARPARSSRCAASTCMRSIISSPNRSAPPWNAATSRSRALDLGLARREGAVARRDLARVDQALAVEAEPPALLGLGEEARRRSSRLLNTPSNTAIPAARAASTISCSDGRDRLARRVERQAQVGAQVVGAGDQRRALRARFPAPRARPRRSRSSPAPACRLLRATTADEMRRHRPRNDDQVGLAIARPRRGPSECHSVPTPLIRIATGIGQSLCDRLDRRVARRRLVLRLHRILEVEDDQVGARSRAPWRSRAGSTPAGTAPTARRTGRCSCRFSLPLAPWPSHHAPNREAGKRNADDFHDRGRGPGAAVRDDGRQDRPPGLSLHDRAFRPLRARRRARLQLRACRSSTASAARST